MKGKYLLLMIISFFTLFSCVSKKKFLEKDQSTIKKESLSDTSAITNNRVEKQNQIHKKETIVELERVIEYDGKQGDSLIEETLHPDGTKTKRTWRGSGKWKESFKEKKGKSEEHQKKDSINYNSIKTSSKKEETHFKANNKKYKNKEVKASCLWFWILLLIITFLVFYLNNRFKWFSRVTAFLTRFIQLRRK